MEAKNRKGLHWNRELKDNHWIWQKTTLLKLRIERERDPIKIKNWKTVSRTENEKDFIEIEHRRKKTFLCNHYILSCTQRLPCGLTLFWGEHTFRFNHFAPDGATTKTLWFVFVLHQRGLWCCKENVCIWTKRGRLDLKIIPPRWPRVLNSIAGLSCQNVSFFQPKAKIWPQFLRQKISILCTPSQTPTE